MRKRRILSFILTILTVLTIAGAYISVPDSFVLYKDRSWNAGSISKLVIDDNSIEVSKGAIVPRKTGDYEASLAIFGIPYKNVTVNVIEEDEVIPGGQSVGIRLYSEGLVVVAVGRANTEGLSPAYDAGIVPGDVIVAIDGKKVDTPDEFTKSVSNAKGAIELEIKNEQGLRKVVITPIENESDGVKRIGLWVRDSTAGVGTLTYMEPESKTYGALGHPVSDADTGVRFEVKRGSIEECAISDIVKGEKGQPGELKGMFFSSAKILGDITKNEKEGIFGNLIGEPKGEAVKLGHKSEIKKGKASIRTSLDGKNVGEYEVEILRISENVKNASKGIVIQVTDEKLLNKTGGIVQGMSGSPIMQNGKLIGAVTHVLVNDPTRGYGIFIENMLSEAKK